MVNGTSWKNRIITYTGKDNLTYRTNWSTNVADTLMFRVDVIVLRMSVVLSGNIWQ